MGEFSLWGSRTFGYCHGSINGADLAGLFVPFRCSGLFSWFGYSGLSGWSGGSPKLIGFIEFIGFVGSIWLI